MNVTMKEIAVQAGVSAATVSRVVNGNAPVDPEKREKVLRILADETASKHWVRHRARSRTRHIALLLLPESKFDFQAVGIKVLTVADLLPRGYELQVYSAKVNAHRIESRFLHGELDGLFLCGHHIEDPFLAFLLEKIPNVWLNSYQLDGQRAVSLMGNEFAGKIAADYLVGHGCRRPAVITITNQNIGLADRISGFKVNCFLHNRAALEIPLKLHGHSLDLEDQLRAGAILEPAVRQALDKFSRKEFPDGFFLPEELLTPRLYRYFMQNKMKKMPVVISCNHTPSYLAGLFPRPASIDLHPEMVVKLAIDELINRIEGKPPRPDNIATIVQPELIPGEIDHAFG